MILFKNIFKIFCSEIFFLANGIFVRKLIFFVGKFLSKILVEKLQFGLKLEIKEISQKKFFFELFLGKIEKFHVVPG